MSKHMTYKTMIGAALMLSVAGAAFGQEQPKPAEQNLPPATAPAPGVRVLDKTTARPIDPKTSTGIAADPAKEPQPGAPNQPAPAVPGKPTVMPTAPVPGAPVQNALPNPFKFEKTSHDWGDIADTAPVEYDVLFSNIATESLTFTVAASCGCTVATPEKTTLAPGEATKVKAKFDPHGRTGGQTKTLTFTVTNPQAKYAQQTFQLAANVKALVTFDPPKIFLNEVDHLHGKKDKITVSGRKEGFKVEKVESSNEFIKTTIGEHVVTEVNGEKVTQCVIELEVGKGAPIGTINSQLTFQTNDERAKLNPVFVGADVVGDVKCTPAQAILRVNTVGTPFTTDVRIDSRSGKEFKITGVEFANTRADMSAVADVKPGPNKAYYMVTISGMTPADPGMHTGYLVVSTDANGGESLRVPFTAAVSRPPTAAAKPGQPAPGAVVPIQPGAMPPMTPAAPAPAPK